MYFLYFKDKETRHILEPYQIGMKDTLPYGASCKHINKGPSGNEGLLLRDAKPDPKEFPSDRFCYDAEVQEWLKIEGSDLWVGIWKDWKPYPDNLLRDGELFGLDIVLEDDNVWVLPEVTTKEGWIKLPFYYIERELTRVGDLIEFCRKVILEAKIWDWALKNEVPLNEAYHKCSPLSEEEMKEGIRRALRVFYRIEKEEIELLGLFRDERVIAEAMSVLTGRGNI